MSGSSHTTFDSEAGDWDLSISASVQRASNKSWTPESPYALMMESVGNKEDMRTIEEVAAFVQKSIWDHGNDGDPDGEAQDDPAPDPEIYTPDPVWSPQPVSV